MDVRELNYFLRTCETLSLSKAALSLFISQQGLSKSITKLENELNVPVFNRTHSGVNLTKHGLIVQKHASRILAEYNAMLRELRETSDSQEHSLNLTLELGTLSILTVTPFLEFMERHPNISLKIQEHTEITCERQVFQEECDLGFTTAPIDTGRFDYLPFFPLKGIVILSRGNKLADKPYITIEDLSGEKLIMCGSAAFYAYTRLFKRSGLEPNIILSSIENTASFDYIRANVGGCPSFHGILNKEGENMSDIVIKPFVGDLNWAICMFMKKHLNPSINTRKFMDFIANYKKQP